MMTEKAPPAYVQAGLLVVTLTSLYVFCVVLFAIGG